MLRTVLVRGLALGTALGVVVAFDTLALTPEARRSALRAFELASLLVALSLPVGLAFAAVPAALGRALGRAAPGLAGPGVPWILLAALLAHVGLNEAKRSIDLLEAWKLPLRMALAAGAVAALAVAARRGRPWRPTAVERALAALALVALAGSGAYALAGPPAPPSAAAPGASPPVAAGSGPAAGAPGTAATASGPAATAAADRDLPPLLAAAPRFEPEPPEALAPPAGARRRRVLAIGLDGASWDRIRAGIEAGRLPTLARLVAEGRTAALATLRPTYSPEIWTTIATGVPPEAHGVRDFYLTQLPRLGIGRFRVRRAFGWARTGLGLLGELRHVPVTSGLRRAKAIWNLADEAGLRAVVLGLWATWPPEPLRHGIVVSDHAPLARRYEWLARAKVDEIEADLPVWPPEVAGELERFQRSPAGVTREELAQFLPVDDRVWRAFERARRFSKGDPLSAFRSTHLNDAFFFAAARHLWETRRPDFLFVYGKAIDELSHFFYEASVPEARELGWSEEEIRLYRDVVDRAYAWTDRQIAPLVAAALADPEVLLVVVSDHGWAREPDGGYDHNEGPPGILILAGDGVCRGDCPPLRDPSVYDVAPTVLAALALPVSDEMPGRVLEEAFAEPPPVRRVAAYGRRIGEAVAVASGIDAELYEKLRALGYAE